MREIGVSPLFCLGILKSDKTRPDPSVWVLDLGGALIQLQELLGRKVDIVTRKGLHWYLHDKIMKEARTL